MKPPKGSRIPWEAFLTTCLLVLKKEVRRLCQKERVLLSTEAL